MGRTSVATLIYWQITFAALVVLNVLAGACALHAFDLFPAITIPLSCVPAASFLWFLFTGHSADARNSFVRGLVVDNLLTKVRPLGISCLLLAALLAFSTTALAMTREVSFISKSESRVNVVGTRYSTRHFLGTTSASSPLTTRLWTGNWTFDFEAEGYEDGASTTTLWITRFPFAHPEPVEVVLSPIAPRSDLRFVDVASWSDSQPAAMSKGTPLDIKLTNRGSADAFVKEASVEVHSLVPLKEYNGGNVIVSAVAPSSEHDLILAAPRGSNLFPFQVSKRTSLAVAAGKPDRFILNLKWEGRGPVLAKLVVKVKYDEDDKTLVSEPIIVALGHRPEMISAEAIQYGVLNGDSWFREDVLNTYMQLSIMDSAGSSNMGERTSQLLREVVAEYRDRFDFVPIGSAYLGVGGSPLYQGFEITNIRPSTVGETDDTGLRIGDVVLSMNDKSVSRVNAPVWDLRAVADFVDAPARGSVTVVVGNLRDDAGRSRRTRTLQFDARMHGSRCVGRLVPQGCRVTLVQVGSPADKAGIKVDDLIATIDDKPLHGFSRLVDAVNAKSPRDQMVLRIRRDGKILKVPVTLEQRPSRQ